MSELSHQEALKIEHILRVLSGYDQRGAFEYTDSDSIELKPIESIALALRQHVSPDAQTRFLNEYGKFGSLTLESLMEVTDITVFVNYVSQYIH